MRHKELFKVYIWLVETVYRLGPISLGEISRLWEESSLYDDNPMTRTTFNRHREEIEKICFRGHSGSESFRLRVWPTNYRLP